MRFVIDKFVTAGRLPERPLLWPRVLLALILAVALSGRPAGPASASDPEQGFTDLTTGDISPDAPVVENTEPEWNLVGTGVDLPGRMLPPPGSTPTTVPAAGERGFFLHRGHYGAYALNDTQMNIAIPREDALVYAPTHLPAGYSCLETTTVHWRPNDPNSNATHHAHGFWDHCNKKGWDTYEQMTSAWQTKYVRVVDNRSRFYSKIEKVGDCWRGSLYDWASYSWVTKADACGAGPYEYGWTMWESSNLMSADTTGSIPCYDLPWITSKYITIKTYWGWYRVSTSHTSSLGPVGKCWENGTYKFAVPESNHHWQGQTRP